MAETTIYALWIDDKKDDEFIERLNRHGIHAHQEFCYEDGIAWLRNKENFDKCDAVILDVKCKIKKTDTQDSDEAFQNYAFQVYGMCETKGSKFIPWFVFTAGTGYKPELLEVGIPKRDWTLTEKKYYSKSSDRSTLIEHIKQLTEKSVNIGIRLSHEGLFDICDDAASTRLLNVIKVIEEDKNYANTSIFNDVRKLLSFIVDYGRKHGLFAKDIIVPNDAKKRLGEISKIDPEIVPVYINTLFYSLAEIANNGSHSAEENEEIQKLSVDKDVLSGDAPYLSRATLYMLLSLLRWCCTLPTDKKAIDELAERIASELSDPIVAYKGRVVNLMYENKYWHFAECMILPRPGDCINEETLVRLIGVEENTNAKSKLWYRYFAKRYQIIKSNNP